LKLSHVHSPEWQIGEIWKEEAGEEGVQANGVAGLFLTQGIYAFRRRGKRFVSPE
jgi:hypothetical protein